MKIKTLDPDGCKALRAALLPALTALGTDLGISFEIGTMRYDPSGLNVGFRLEACKTQNGVPVNKQALDFLRSGVMNGFAEDDLGREFDSPKMPKGGPFIIIGWSNNAARKLIVKAKRGAQYRFDHRAVLEMLGRDPQGRRGD